MRWLQNDENGDRGMPFQHVYLPICCVLCESVFLWVVAKRASSRDAYGYRLHHICTAGREEIIVFSPLAARRPKLDFLGGLPAPTIRGHQLSPTPWSQAVSKACLIEHAAKGRDIGQGPLCGHFSPTARKRRSFESNLLGSCLQLRGRCPLKARP
jgi:hypothetical protein